VVRTERPYVFRAKGAAFNFEAGATPQLVELGALPQARMRTAPLELRFGGYSENPRENEMICNGLEL